MMTVFADTSFYIALVNPDDEAHPAAIMHAESFRGQVVTTDFVIVELGNMLSRIKDREVFLRIRKQLHLDLKTTVVPTNSELLERAVNLFASRSDKEWSLTDCSSFVVMADRKIGEALTTDHHFNQAGIAVLLK